MTDNEELPNHKTWWRGPVGALVRIVLTVALTWLAFRAMDLSLRDLLALDLSIITPRPTWLVVSVILLLASFGVSALLWTGLVTEFSGPVIPLGHAAAFVLVANLGRYIPGKVWQLAGLAYLTAQRGIPPRTAALAAVAGQVFHLGSAALVGGILALERLEISLQWGITVASVTFVVLAIIGETSVFRSFLAWAAGSKMGDEDASVHLRRGFAVRWLVLYALNWLVLGTAFWAMTQGLDVPTPWTLAVPGFAAAYLAGYLVLFAPAGIGVREAFLVAALQPVLGPAGAVAVAGGQRVWITGVELVGAALGALVLRKAGPDKLSQ